MTRRERCGTLDHFAGGRRRQWAAARIRSCAVAFAALLATAAPGRAQLLGQYLPTGIPGYQNWFSDAVLDRPRSEYDPIGVRAGDFVIRPSLSESFGYDSNSFGLPHPAGSPFAETQGSVRASSDWSRNALDATLGFDDERALRYPDLSHTDWTAALGGALDVLDDRATVAYSHVTATTAAFQIGTLSAGQPVTVSIDDARASFQAAVGRFTLVPAIDAAVSRFTNVLLGGRSEALDDRDSVTGSFTAGYELAPGSSLVAVASGTDADYTSHAPGLPAPSYTDVSLLAGLDVRGFTVFRYRALLGYERRSYAEAYLPGTAAPLGEADVIWTPTRMTTVTGQVSHSLQNAITPGVVQSYAYGNLRLTLDHELRRNVLLQAFGQFQSAAYQTQDGQQHVLSAGASVTWLLNRKLSLTAASAIRAAATTPTPGSTRPTRAGVDDRFPSVARAPTMRGILSPGVDHRERHSRTSGAIRRWFSRAARFSPTFARHRSVRCC